MAPWAALLYACDADWWRLRGPGPEAFRGLRMIGNGSHPGCIEADVAAGSSAVLRDGRRLGGGGNSGFQACNLAARCGARRIVLTGFDMQGSDHWHGRHGRGLQNPPADAVGRWRKAMDAAAPAFRALGVEIINASRETALTAYPRMSIEDALCLES